MAGNLTTYARASIYINGVYLAEATNVSVQRTSGNLVQKTLGKDFAGVSPGAKGLKITVDNAVPSVDFELNPGQFMKTTEVVTITVYVGEVRHITTKGFIMEDNFSHAVNSEAKLSFTFEGEWVDYD